MPPNLTPNAPSAHGPKRRISLHTTVDVLLVLLIMAAILTMLLVWKPWAAKASDRFIKVTGNSTVQAEPDEFIFMPSYDFTGANKDAALKQLVKKSDNIIAELKKLGVAEAKIKSNAGDYKTGIYYPYYNSTSNSYTLSLTITATNKELAQKVQDYLITTKPSGSVTPYADFSESKRKSLEEQARGAAEKDARAKAEQSAKNIGFKLGKVKSVDEGGLSGQLYPAAQGAADSLATSPTPKLSVQPGENELSYSVDVTYFIR